MLLLVASVLEACCCLIFLSDTRGLLSNGAGVVQEISYYLLDTKDSGIF